MNETSTPDRLGAPDQSTRPDGGRRGLLVTLGSVAAVACLGVGAWAVSQSGTPDDGIAAAGSASTSTGIATPTPTPAPNDRVTAPSDAPEDEVREPIDGRSTAALAIAVLGDVAPATGAPTGIAGQGGTVDSGEETYAEFGWTAGTGSAKVGVNVQDWPMRGLGDTCQGFEQFTDCATRKLPGDVVLRTYLDTTDKPGLTRQVAEVLIANRGLRLVVGVTQPSGEARMLTDQQVAAVATDERWDWLVSPEVASAGRDLLDYTDLDATVGPATSPTPAG